jgi:hypothetical protein
MPHVAIPYQFSKQIVFALDRIPDFTQRQRQGDEEYNVDNNQRERQRGLAQARYQGIGQLPDQAGYAFGPDSAGGSAIG